MCLHYSRGVDLHRCETPQQVSGPAQVCEASEVDVGDLDVSVDLQPVDLTEGGSVREVEHVQPVHKHLELLVPTTNRNLRHKPDMYTD